VLVAAPVVKYKKAPVKESNPKTISVEASSTAPEAKPEINNLSQLAAVEAGSSQVPIIPIGAGAVGLLGLSVGLYLFKLKKI
jgi:hypothetical protein